MNGTVSSIKRGLVCAVIFVGGFGLVPLTPRTEAVGDSRSALVPIEDRPRIARIDAPWIDRIALADIEVDESTRRVFASLPTANRIVVFSFDGALVGVIAASQPGEMTLDSNWVYVVEQGNGSISRIDRNTLAKSQVATGLDTPRGLTTAGGMLYTAATGVVQSNSYVYLHKVDPASGIVSMVDPPVVAVQFQSMVDPSPQPGVIFGSSTESFPNGLSRVELANPANTLSISDSFSCTSSLDDGELLLGLRGEVFAASATTFQDKPRRWAKDWSEVLGCSAGGGVVAVFRQGTVNPFGTQVEIRAQKNPGAFIRGYSLADGSYIRNRLRIGRNGSLVVLPAIRNGGIDLFLLPGVRLASGAPGSTGTAIATTRLSAPVSAPIATSTGRKSAPSTGSPAAIEMDVEDWLIDAVGGNIFTTNSFQSAVNILDLDGNPLASIRDLPGPRGMTICNGVVYVSLYGSGEIVRLTRESRWSTQLVTTAVPRPGRLICAGGSLFAISERPLGSVTTPTELVFKISGSQATQVPIQRSSSLHARFGTDTAIFSFQSSEFQKFDFTTNTHTSAPSLVGYPRTIVQLVHFYPDKAKFLDYNGNRYTTATMLADGVRFPGVNAIVSETLTPYVAVYTQYPTQTIISVFDANDPTNAVRSFTVDAEFQPIDQEFIPGTTKLRMLVRQTDGRYLVLAAPEI